MTPDVPADVANVTPDVAADVANVTPDVAAYVVPLTCHCTTPWSWTKIVQLGIRLWLPADYNMGSIGQIVALMAAGRLQY